MEYLRIAAFAGLFTTAFAVGAASQPGMVNMNGIAAAAPIQALGSLLFLLVVGLSFNSGFSAIGSECWLLARRWLPRPADT